jgi:hypothetical protein
MFRTKLRRPVGVGACAGAAALAMATVLSGGVASAASAPDPVGGNVPLPPHFYNGNVEGIRDSGSDTTFFLMQKIGDMYTAAGLYGCILNTGAGQTLYNSADPASSSANQQDFCQKSANVSTTDVADNWDRTEVTEGVDDVGSGAGQAQLCGTVNSPLTVDFARSSKPQGGTCAGEQEYGYAKDGVPLVAFSTTGGTLNPGLTYGAVPAGSPYANVNGGVIGPVYQGWLPGNAIGGPFTGAPFTGVSNIDNGGGAGSTAYRIWCASGTTRITDVGQLTNLGPSLVANDVNTTNTSSTISLSFGGTFSPQIAVGATVSGPGIQGGTTVSTNGGTTLTLSLPATANSTAPGVTLTIGITAAAPVGSGQPIGLPVRVQGVNSASGTEATFASYAESGVSGGGCASNLNTNAAGDPAVVGSPAEIALENNATQLGGGQNDFASGDFPGDPADQAVEMDLDLYFESNGVYNTTPFATQSQIWSSGTPGTGTSATYSVIKLSENSKTPTSATLLGNTYPTARTLFNIALPSLRSSVGGFINWICDSNVNFQKDVDKTTGKTFAAELNTLIGTTYGFPELTDVSGEPATGTPADNQPAPDDTCAAQSVVTTTATSANIVLSSGGDFPPSIVAGTPVSGTSDVPSGTTVSVPESAQVLETGGSTTVTVDNGLSVPNTITAGTPVRGANIPAGTTVATNNGTNLVLTNAITLGLGVTADGVIIGFNGGVLTLSNAATVSGASVTIDYNNAAFPGVVPGTVGLPGVQEVGTPES